MHPQCENTICIIVLPTHEHWPTDVSRIPSDVITPLVDRYRCDDHSKLVGIGGEYTKLNTWIIGGCDRFYAALHILLPMKHFS